jgi:hypothetical protein
MDLLNKSLLLLLLLLLLFKCSTIFWKIIRNEEVTVQSLQASEHFSPAFQFFILNFAANISC